MAKDYILGNTSPEGLALNVARGIGEQAIIASAKARLQAKSENKYVGYIDSELVTAQQVGLSDFNQPIYAAVTFGNNYGKKLTYTNKDGDIITVPSLTLQAVLVSVSFPRNIVKTTIQGRDGTVKEYIGEGDAVLSFRGVITGTNGNYPTDDVMTLKEIIKAPIPIPIICSHLNNLGINSIVFEDRALEQEEGSISYQAFTLNAISDTPQTIGYV